MGGNLKDGISIPLTTSVGDDRGFAYCPAILAIRTTGNFAPQIRTKLICNITFIFASIGSYGQLSF